MDVVGGGGTGLGPEDPAFEGGLAEGAGGGEEGCCQVGVDGVPRWVWWSVIGSCIESREK
jgi:hypothetical protein